MIEPGTVPTAIRRYQQRCHREYSKAVGLPEPYTYPDGNPIRPVPPIQTALGGLMIVGAYPSARFESRMAVDGSNRQRLVPVADNLQPFWEEEYFDGTRVRTLESGHGLRKYLLEPLAIGLSDCWVTDLVKVFLYKAQHLESCKAACPSFSPTETRSRFMELAKASLPWLKEECELARPKLVITLGEEVAQAVTGEFAASADDLLNRLVIRNDRIGGWPVLCLPHPDACRRNTKWAEAIEKRAAQARAILT